MYLPGQLLQVPSKCFCLIGTGASGAAGSADWQPWTIPREATFVSFMLVGAGGGGGAGTAGAAGGSRAGGGGGGGPGFSSALFQAKDLPGTLYFNLTPGGPGGVTSGQTAGGGGNVVGSNSGIASFICSFPNITVVGNIILEANGGNGGANAGNATSGNTIATSQIGFTSRALSFNSVSNVVGGAQANPGSSVLASFATTPGAGGGGTSTSTPSNGGSVQSNDLIIQGGLTSFLAVTGGVSATPVNGCSGYDTIVNMIPYGSSTSPWYSFGGAGGASSNAGQGGNGGNGGLGSGGGGGGAGVTGQQGVGGNGGASFCLVRWW